MQALTNSAFLQALGYAIANSLWQMALLWIVFVLVTSVFKLNANNKYKVAASSQLLGFVWFTVTFQFYYLQCSAAIKETVHFASQNNFALIVPQVGEGFRGNMINIILKGEQLLPYLSVAYLLLLIFLCVKWIRSYQQAQNIRTNGLHKIDVNWKLFVKRIAEQLGIKKSVRIYLSEQITTPMTIGFLKPIILVPLASINHLSEEQMEAVLLHELAHIKRFDYLLNLILSVVEIILFFNPFTQLISKSIKKEREHSCDDWVLQFQYNPSMYAEALLRIAYLQTNPTFAMTAVNNKNDLLSRVRRMIDNKDSRFNYKQQLLALLLMTAIFSSFTLLQPINNSSNNDYSVQLKNKKAFIVEPMAAKVSNPFFNPVFFLQQPLKDEIEKAAKQVAQSAYISHKDFQAAQKELASVIPIAAKSLEEINWKEVNKDIAASMKAVEEQTMNETRMRIDSSNAAYKQGFTYNFNYETYDDASKAFKQANEEIKRVNIDLRKAFDAKERDWTKINEAKKVQSQLNNLLAQLKKQGIPFLSTIKIPRLNWRDIEEEANTNIERQNLENNKELPTRNIVLSPKKNRIKLDSLRKVQLSFKTLAGKELKLTRTNDAITCIPSTPPHPTTPQTVGIGGYMPDVVTGNSYSYSSDNERISISSSNSSENNETKIKLKGNGNNSKHYEIVITNKQNTSKKIIVEVE